MAITREWKVYGMDGSRQRESFDQSYKVDYTGMYGRGLCIIEVENADKILIDKNNMPRKSCRKMGGSFCVLLKKIVNVNTKTHFIRLIMKARKYNA